MIKEVINTEKRFNENRVGILKSLLNDKVISYDEYKVLVRLELGFEERFIFIPNINVGFKNENPINSWLTEFRKI